MNLEVHIFKKLEIIQICGDSATRFWILRKSEKQTAFLTKKVNGNSAYQNLWGTAKVAIGKKLTMSPYTSSRQPNVTC